MILRKNHISPTAEEVSFAVSFSSYDVWKWLNRHAVVLMYMDKPENKDMLEWSFEREDYEEGLVRDPYALGWLPSKHAKKIAEWAINVAISRGYLSEKGSGYSYSPTVCRRNGRPKGT